LKEGTASPTQGGGYDDTGAVPAPSSNRSRMAVATGAPAGNASGAPAKPLLLVFARSRQTVSIRDSIPTARFIEVVLPLDTGKPPDPCLKTSGHLLVPLSIHSDIRPASAHENLSVEIPLLSNRNPTPAQDKKGFPINTDPKNKSGPGTRFSITGK